MHGAPILSSKSIRQTGTKKAFHPSEQTMFFAAKKALIIGCLFVVLRFVEVLGHSTSPRLSGNQV